MYEELRKKAEDMGIQITDLVKFYIRQGMEKEEDEDVGKSSEYEENIAFLEAKVAQLDAIVGELVRKLKNIEDEDIGEEEVELKEREEND
ncbi:hypothetical protein HS5_10090 [Acidianus sp. HS-5]|nr:hypothetical protein HS5_10090 [Acidianus sp. HS-5]